MLISVVIPTYNSAQFLTATIESVRSQTYTNWELLIIDGGSQDKTWEIIHHYCDRDSRIKAFSQTGGVSVSRNTGVRLSQGEIVAFLDSDDLWLPDKLAAHVEHFESSANPGVSFARVEFIRSDGSSTRTFSSARVKGLQPQDFLYNNPTTSVSNLAVRKQILQQIQFDESMSYSEDLDWLFRVMYVGKWGIEGIDRVLLQYRTNNTGLSSNLYKMEAGWHQFIERAKEYAPDLVSEHYTLAKAVQLRYLARRAFRLNLPAKTGVDFITRSLQADWKLILKEPLRTLLTSGAIYGTYLLNTLGL